MTEQQNNHNPSVNPLRRNQNYYIRELSVQFLLYHKFRFTEDFNI